ncbi:MAG: ATP-binding protein [Acidimicrobiia bacterium]|jgi:hypothetical protein
MRFSNISNDFNSYQQLITFYEENKDEFFLNIQLDINNFFCANVSAVLGAILDKLILNANNIHFRSIDDKIKEILKKNDFLSFYGYNSEVDIHNTTIKYKKILPTDGKYFVNYIEKELIDSNLSILPRMSKGIKEGIIEAIYEVFVNAQIHSQTKYIYSCGQFFPGSNELFFTLVDTGISIKNCVNKRFKSNLTSVQAIKWALVDRNTTKEHITGGIGLALLKDFIKNNRGLMQIISNDGYYSLDDGREVYKLFSGQFPGTVVTIKFKTDDKHHYSLKNEKDINFENIF